jgi:hypothetical protein
MKKSFLVIVAATLACCLLSPSSSRAEFVIGGTPSGWQLSTNGIVDVFATYKTTSSLPSGDRFVSLLGNDASNYQHFDIQVGLLPSVVGFTIKAPTMNGIESSAHIGIYPSIQNTTSNRFETNPNIDFREIYYTAKGNFGEILAGRALNLYQSKNILTDMTLLTAGVVPIPGTTTTLGHIGYGYLYTNFGPQLRYTTPDFKGAKFALSVGEPYDVSSQGGDKTNTPRFEAEISYATVLTNGTTLQGWLDGLYQSATMTAGSLDGHHVHSAGGAAGVEGGFHGISLLASGYYGEGLGMISAQDGSAFGNSPTDAVGQERTEFGFLLQATYQLLPSTKIGVNYGQNRQLATDNDEETNYAGSIPMKRQEAATAMVAYNLTKSIQFVGEYSYAQNKWYDGSTQQSNNFNIGTMYYW